jgi:hypothetical protein
MQRSNCLDSFEDMQDYAAALSHSATPSIEESFLFHFSSLLPDKSSPWINIASQLSPECVGQLAIPLIKYLITSNNDSLATKDVMKFYDALRRWQISELSSADEIHVPLQKVRQALLRSKSQGVAGQRDMETIRLFSLLEFAIRTRMGLDNAALAAEYSQALTRNSETMP